MKTIDYLTILYIMEISIHTNLNLPSTSTSIMTFPSKCPIHSVMALHQIISTNTTPLIEHSECSKEVHLNLVARTTARCSPVSFKLLMRAEGKHDTLRGCETNSLSPSVLTRHQSAWQLRDNLAIWQFLLTRQWLDRLHPADVVTVTLCSAKPV